MCFYLYFIYIKNNECSFTAKFVIQYNLNLNASKSCLCKPESQFTYINIDSVFFLFRYEEEGAASLGFVPLVVVKRIEIFVYEQLLVRVNIFREAVIYTPKITIF